MPQDPFVKAATQFGTPISYKSDNSPMVIDGVQLDPKVVKVMRAIRDVESGGNYNAVGDAGDAHGAFQYNEKTGPGWKNIAREYLGDENAPMDKANQNKATYYRIKKWKDEGKQPEEIAALWNGAHKDENGRYTYNAPEYGEKFRAALMKQGASQQANVGAQVAPPVPQVPGLPPPPPRHTATNTATQIEPSQEQDGFLETLIKDPIKTLLVKPADRFAEAVGRTGILGEDIKKGYEQMADEGQSRTFAGIEVEPQKAFGEGGAAQIAGDVLKSGSYLYTGGKVPGLVQQGMKGNILRAGLQGAQTGAITGAAYGAGDALHQGQDAQGVLTNAAIGGGIGLATGGVLGGAGGAVGTALNRNQVVKDMIRSDVDTLLKNGRAMTNATALVRKKNVPIEDILSDPEVFRGLKVEGNKIEPDDALAVLDERIDSMMDAKGKLLKEFDRTSMQIPREEIRKRAKEMATKLSPADEAILMRNIDEQIDALPESMTLSQLDDFRARFRASARNARGLQKSDNEYSALENATRDTLFDATDNLPLDTNKEFPQLNNEIKNLIGAREFIDKTLRGRNAPGAGWAREALARLLGGMAGGVTGTGPLGVILGSEAGRMIANIIANKNLGNSFKMKLIKEMTDEPDVLKAAKELLEKAQSYNPAAERLALPAPKAIPVGPAGSTRPQEPMQVVPAIKGVPGQTPAGKPGAGRFFRTYQSGLVPPNKKQK